MQRMAHSGEHAQGTPGAACHPPPTRHPDSPPAPPALTSQCCPHFTIKGLSVSLPPSLPPLHSLLAGFRNVASHTSGRSHATFDLSLPKVTRGPAQPPPPWPVPSAQVPPEGALRCLHEKLKASERQDTSRVVRVFTKVYKGAYEYMCL